MKVKLVSITDSLVFDESGKKLTPEQLLVYIARVSNPSNQLNTETSDKLLGYMIKNKHWSPFDMVNMTIEVTTSKAISIQILRHWSIKPQEFSQRYAEVVDIEPIELRKTATTNRQSSETVFDPKVEIDCGNDVTKDIASLAISDHIQYTVNLYKALIKSGVAKECARMILPMATSTTMYLNGSVRSWIHYLEQRTDLHAQLEHRQVAAVIKQIFVENFPNISKALNYE
jgi:thymidylate synthase (FAD)